MEWDLERDIEWDLERDMEWDLECDMEWDLERDMEWDLECNMKCDMEWDLERDMEWDLRWDSFTIAQQNIKYTTIGVTVHPASAAPVLPAAATARSGGTGPRYRRSICCRPWPTIVIREIINYCNASSHIEIT